jgi:hypothetical protein
MAHICSEAHDRDRGSAIFWDVIHWGLARAHWYIRGVYCHSHQGWKVSRARERQEVGSKQCLNIGGLVPNYIILRLEKSWSSPFQEPHI